MQMNLIEVNNLSDEFALNRAIVQPLSNMDAFELVIAILLFIFEGKFLQV